MKSFIILLLSGTLLLLTSCYKECTVHDADGQLLQGYNGEKACEKYIEDYPNHYCICE